MSDDAVKGKTLVEGFAAEAKKEAEPEQEPRRQVQTVAVKLIERRGKSVVVQYVRLGKTVRAMIPADILADRMPKDVMDAAVPMSVPWAELVVPSVTGEQLETALRNHGVWTKTDYRTKQREVMSAIQIVVSDVLTQLREAMEAYGGE